MGVSYNSYVILDEKIAVMDSVDARATEEWLSNVARVLEEMCIRDRVSILAPRQESKVASSSSEIPEKSAAAWSVGKNSFIESSLSLKIQLTCCF